VSIEGVFDNEELNQFSKLLQVVWNKITALDLPDTSDYEKNLKGILKFEQDLLNEIEN
jgi:hypothetical protein